MKLQLALAIALLAVSTSAAQAADTRTPDILGSVSVGSVQALSKADASNTRGEYRVTNPFGSYSQTSYTPLGEYDNFWGSRKYSHRIEDGNYYIYVSR